MVSDRLYDDLSDAERAVYDAVNDDHTTANAVTESVDYSTGTVRKHLKTLTEAGYLSREKDGRSYAYAVTTSPAAETTVEETDTTDAATVEDTEPIPAIVPVKPAIVRVAHTAPFRTTEEFSQSDKAVFFQVDRKDNTSAGSIAENVDYSIGQVRGCLKNLTDWGYLSREKDGRAYAYTVADTAE